MIRAALVLLILAIIGAVAALFAEHPGRVAVDWNAWRIDTSVSAVVLGFALIIIFSNLLYRVWAWIRSGPGRRTVTRQNGRRQRGYRALTQGMVAVAAGDANEAMRLAHSAEALLQDPPLTLLLSAQSAQLQGDERAAEKYFRAMLLNPEQEFLGLRGLLSQSLRSGESAAALEFALRAYALKPETEWVQTTLFELQMASGQWKRAEALLQDMGRQSKLTSVQAKKRRAILFYEQAKMAQSARDMRGAIRFAVKAHRTATNFIPAAVLAAGLLSAAGKQRKAAAIVATTWSAAPHPDLVDAFRSMWPNDSPEKRLERFAQMFGDRAFNEGTPGFIETKFGLARFAVDARDWSAARRYLAAITLDQPSARVCRLWAELEDAENGPGLAARDWLMKAANSKSDPGWVCWECGQVSAAWSACCSRCQTFDSLDWHDVGGPVVSPMTIPDNSLRSTAASPELSGDVAALLDPSETESLVASSSNPMPK